MCYYMICFDMNVICYNLYCIRVRLGLMIIIYITLDEFSSPAGNDVIVLQVWKWVDENKTGSLVTDVCVT